MVANVKHQKSGRRKPVARSFRRRSGRHLPRNRAAAPEEAPALSAIQPPGISAPEDNAREDDEPKEEDLAKEEAALKAEPIEENTPEEEASPRKERTSYDGDTAIKLYLREIGQVKLLTPQEEIEL